MLVVGMALKCMMILSITKNSLCCSMKKRFYIIIFVLILGVAIVIPLFECCRPILDYLSQFSIVLTPLLAILTAFIAIALYDRFSAEKDLLGKQLENVFVLIENLQINGFLIRVRENGQYAEHCTSYFLVHPSKRHLSEKYDPPYLDYRIGMSSKANQRLFSILDGVSMVYLPKEIYNACKDLFSPKNSRQIDGKQYVMIVDIHPLKGATDFDMSIIYDYNGHTLRSLCESLNNLYDEIEKWLTNHAVDVDTVRKIDWIDQELIEQNVQMVPIRKKALSNNS